MKRAGLLFSLLFVAAVFIGGATVRLSQPSPQTKFTPYTIAWQVLEIEKSGNRIIRTETKAVSADGRWSNTKAFPDGSREVMFAEPGRGVFGQKEDHLQFLSACSTTPRTGDYFTSPQYTRTEEILGYKTAVLTQSVNPEFQVEHYIAPALNNDIIKTAITMGDNVRVLEPLVIISGEPPTDVFKHRELPVRYDVYNQKHADSEK